MYHFLDQLFEKSNIPTNTAPEETLFHSKYHFFKQLLSHNNKALQLINNLENLLFVPQPFTFDEVLCQCEELVGVVYELAEDLNALSQGKYPGLFSSSEKIGIQVLRGLSRQRKLERSCLVLPLVGLSHENQARVGGKAANLGEVSNRAGLPTPQGFVVTAYACHHFLRSSNLYDAIRGELKGVDIQDTDHLEAACREIQKMILNASLPEDLESRIYYEAREMASELGPETRMAVRSSATGEDSESSFAGQHSTVLNVTADTILDAYKEVVASMYTPRAVFYRRSVGYRDQDMQMCVLCLNMVDARASGVMYTQDPNKPGERKLIISAAWGLGVSVVDGSMPTDMWQVTSSGNIETVTVHKTKRIVMNPAGGLHEVPVDPHLQDQPCLGEDDVAKLAEYGIHLENHYKLPLDIEWAMDQAGKIFILQARPLNLLMSEEEHPSPDSGEEGYAGHELVLQGGSTASTGTASGPAFVLKTEHNLSAVPQGAILVTTQTSPMYVSLMSKVHGIITDVGSVTGHMASVAREFGIPTLVGTENATSVIPHGEEITLDASRRAVYSGRVMALIRTKPQINLMKGSPLFRLVKETLQNVVPLNLIDPKQADFTPEGCLTLHDVVRFAHEKAMSEMFCICEDIQEDTCLAVKLHTTLPLNTYILDLGGGFNRQPEQGVTDQEGIASKPFVAMLRGMTHPGVRWGRRVEVESNGSAAISHVEINHDPANKSSRGGPNYAIISDDYLNYSARLGYHFVTIDAYCGEQVNDNYIVFLFKGGAADISRRTRRALMISTILKRLGLRVEHKGDMVRGEIKKYDCPRMMEKLEFIGRLLGSVRLLDMVLTDEAQIPWYVEQFFKGNYTFEQ
ncbi:phosphoenolpyruvate synthase [Desulfonatronum thiosulfatophilum]|uniref:Phosphoenolpyruvate synthase n=1 Tax=Desulfonatronum thiosulfatophilum TaxID=617002 RepID=A0A1G6DHD9_9BACT|nr:PEP/pyruvate-binding domain-containing protein [Desulfonatronum thiosulfatophilum]SDB44607.1 phosphoenolpyruvate synthase [Desulfonatronum thiosulfatophilum]